MTFVSFGQSGDALKLAVEVATQQSEKRLSVLNVKTDDAVTGVIIAVNFSLCNEEEIAKLNDAIEFLKSGEGL